MSSKSEGDLERLRRLHLFRIFKEVACYDRCMFCILGEGITELTGEDIKIMLKRSMRENKKISKIPFLHDQHFHTSLSPNPQQKEGQK